MVDWGWWRAAAVPQAAPAAIHQVAQPSYNLLMQASRAIDVERIREAARRLDLELVVLFGSYAGGALPPRPTSDVDLAVLLPRSSPSRGLSEVYRMLAPAVEPATLDIVIVNTTDPLLRLEIMSRGALLYGDPTLFEEQRLLAYRLYTDSADLRELEGTLFQKRMAYLRGVLDGAT
jgi:predicted nucleotidyltransferase